MNNQSIENAKKTVIENRNILFIYFSIEKTKFQQEIQKIKESNPTNQFIVEFKMKFKIMKINLLKSLPFILAAISLPVIATPLSVRLIGESPAQYQCNDGKKITANFYELSDKSLQFVKLIVNKHEVTLPAVISASGARYSDSYKFEWWIKGTSATLNMNISNKEQKWIECSLIS